MGDRLIRATLRDPIAAPLLASLGRDYAERYPDFLVRPGRSLEMELYPPILFEPPYGRTLLIVRAGTVIAGGSFMELDRDTVELKRVWTSPDHRRQGLSRRIVAALEKEAAGLGYSRVFLTTGPGQPEAVGSYLDAGYTPQFDVDGDWGLLSTLPFEKHITPTGPRRRRLNPLMLLKWRRQRRLAERGRQHHGEAGAP